MKTKSTLTIFFLIAILSSCHTPKYLYRTDEIDVNEYGSYIKFKSKLHGAINGELIEIDSNQLVVLEEYSRKCVIVPMGDIEKFRIKYAKSSYNYEYYIPVVGVLPFINGLVSVFTIPLHLVVTVSVAVSSQYSFTYSQNNITYEDLKMFSRFPQGVPKHILLQNIK